MKRYTTVIGLEVHAELHTNSKIFCGCKNEFGGSPNSHCCPVCLGLPGSLPVLNKKVVEYAMKTGLALNCEISHFSKMDRKNYFYPDSPKAYQISQFDLPICKNGWLEIEINGETKRIGITRIHIEEDAGKLLHADEGEDYSLADYNRTGVPLIEIVSEPDLRSPEEAKLYVEKLKSILEYIEVSDGKMQEGSLRCDANLSLMPIGSEKFGTRAEVKNMNSMKAIQKAMEFEEIRQAEVLNNGELVIQETRRWDDGKGVTVSMRSKELAHDYRYFPEPDLVPIVIEEDWIEEIRTTLPELAEARMKRFVSEYEIPEYDARVLTLTKAMAEFYENCVKEYTIPKTVSNWVMGDISRILKERDMEIVDITFSAHKLASMLKMIEKGTISGSAAKTVLEKLFETGKDPEILVKDMGLEQISDETAISAIIRQVIMDNPKSIEDFKGGKDRAVGFLVGQTMKASKGKGNPGVINKLLLEIMEEYK